MKTAAEIATYHATTGNRQALELDILRYLEWHLQHHVKAPAEPGNDSNANEVYADIFKAFKDGELNGTPSYNTDQIFRIIRAAGWRLRKLQS